MVAEMPKIIKLAGVRRLNTNTVGFRVKTHACYRINYSQVHEAKLPQNNVKTALVTMVNVKKCFNALYL